MDYLVRKCREVKANRKEFACKIPMKHFEVMDEIIEQLLFAELEEGVPVTNKSGRPQPIARHIVDTF